jgi:hypothetical protein
MTLARRLPQAASARRAVRGACLAAGMAFAAGIAPSPARAEITAAQAASIEAQLRAFITRQIGALVDASALAFKATPDGDSIRLELPVGGPMAGGMLVVSPGVFNLRIKPLDGSRYAVEALRLPSPLTISTPPEGKAKGRTTTFKIAEQETTGTVDTSLATTSSLDTKLRDYSSTADGPGGPQTTHVDRLTGHTTLLPKGGARVDVTGNSEGEKITQATRTPDGTLIDVSADRLIAAVRMDNFDFDRAGALVQASANLGASIKGNDKADKPTAVQRALMRTILMSLAELMDGMSSDQTLQNMRVTSGGQTGTLKKLSVGFAASAPNGLMQIKLPIALEGLESPMIPAGAMRELLPRSVSLIPRLGGVPKAELMTMLLKALDSDTPDTAAMQAEAMEMLEKNPLTLGVDKLAIDVGIASLTGGGEVKVTSATEYAGQGELRMTGLDALIRRANGAPELKMAAPALIFLKGIGRPEGKDMVWHISYDDRVLMVNDTNVSEMMGGK